MTSKQNLLPVPSPPSHLKEYNMPDTSSPSASQKPCICKLNLPFCYGCLSTFGKFGRGELCDGVEKLDMVQAKHDPELSAIENSVPVLQLSCNVTDAKKPIPLTPYGLFLDPGLKECPLCPLLDAQEKAGEVLKDMNTSKEARMEADRQMKTLDGEEKAVKQKYEIRPVKKFFRCEKEALNMFVEFEMPNTGHQKAIPRSRPRAQIGETRPSSPPFPNLADKHDQRQRQTFPRRASWLA